MDRARETRALEGKGSMRRYCVIGVVAASILSVLGCDSTGPTRLISVPFSDVEGYGHFCVREKGIAVIRSDSEWTELWESYWNLYDRSGNRTPPPEIDFESEMVIGVFWGGTYAGCTNESPSIESVSVVCGHVYVVVGELADLGFCRMIVYPLHLIRLQRYDLPVIFMGNVP